MPDDKDTKYPPTSWYDPRVEIRLSTIQGGGMFAARRSSRERPSPSSAGRS